MKIVKNKYYEIVDEVLEQLDINGKVCIDATLGNGHDSLKILKKNPEGFLYAFDIQNTAIEKSDELLNKNGFNNYKLIKDSHDNMKEYVKGEAELIIFNLGYLPGADKKVVTKPHSTIMAIKSAIDIISKSGVIIVVSYLGHRGSFAERAAIEEYLSNLPQKELMVEKREFFNQVNTPPVVYLIKKEVL